MADKKRKGIFIEAKDEDNSAASKRIVHTSPIKKSRKAHREGKGVLINAKDGYYSWARSCSTGYDADNDEKEEEVDNVELLDLVVSLNLLEKDLALQAQLPKEPSNPIPVTSVLAEEYVPDFAFLGDKNPEDIHIPALKMSSSLWRRNLPYNSLCVVRTLAPSEVLAPNAYLTLSITEAKAISGNSNSRNTIDIGGLHKTILVYDMEDLEYKMLFTNYTDNKTDNSVFCLTGEGWDAFVLKHCLKYGDVVNIHMAYDPRISNDNYLVIKFFRMPKLLPRNELENGNVVEDQESSKQRRSIDKGKAKVVESEIITIDTISCSSDDEDNVRDLKKIAESDLQYAIKMRNTPITTSPMIEIDDSEREFLENINRPEDHIPALRMSPRTWRRNLPLYCHCVNLTLNSSDVRVPNAHLNLDLYSASQISEDGNLDDTIHARHFHMRMLVFDKDHVEYKMVLSSYNVNEMDIGFRISEGWNGFVIKHGLKAGYELSVYRTFDPRVYEDDYFVFKIRKTRSKRKFMRKADNKEEEGATHKKRKAESGGSVLH